MDFLSLTNFESGREILVRADSVVVIMDTYGSGTMVRLRGHHTVYVNESVGEVHELINQDDDND